MTHPYMTASRTHDACNIHMYIHMYVYLEMFSSDIYICMNSY